MTEDSDQTKVPATDDEVVKKIEAEHTNAYGKWQMLRQEETVKAMEGSSSSGAKFKVDNMGFFAKLAGELRNKIYHLALVERDSMYNMFDVPFTVEGYHCE